MYNGCIKGKEVIKMSYSDRKKQYNTQYKKDHLKRIPLDVTLDKYERIKKYTIKHGLTVNGFIKSLIDEALKDYDTSKEQ